MPGLSRIHHVAILTDDYATSKRFYTEILGFEVIAEHYRAERKSYKLDLAVGGVYAIELFSFPEFRERGSYPESKGLRHLAFATDDVEAFSARLRANGVNTEAIRTDEFTGKKFFFFLDPNGQPLEIYES